MIAPARAASLCALAASIIACVVVMRPAPRPVFTLTYEDKPLQCVPFMSDTTRKDGTHVRAQVNMDGSITVSDWSALAALSAEWPGSEQYRFFLEARAHLQEVDEAEARRINNADNVTRCAPYPGFAALMNKLNVAADDGPEL